MAIPPVVIPFFRAGDLPGPLPTLLEIQENSQPELSPRRSAMGSVGGFSIIRDTYVVKFGATVTENEGHALLFAEQNLDIPAPRLYAMYRAPPLGHLYLVLELIHGVSLESIWGSLATESKLSIAIQLRAIFASMRTLSPPQAFIGSISGGGIPDPIFHTPKPNAEINGPFETTDEVGRAMARASREVWSDLGRQGWMSTFFSRHLATALKDHAVKFTHGDLHLRNILVEKEPLQDGLESTAQSDEESMWRVKGLIDWESAGWYPAYWEYASAMARSQIEDDWPESLDTVLIPYPLEFSMLFLVLQDLQLVY